MVGAVSLLASLLIATVAAGGPDTASYQCMNNLRQLGYAWRMYADDNLGTALYNRDGAGAGRDLADASWVAGWLDFSSSTDNTNTDMLIDHARYPYAAFLGPYLQTASVFKCPADPSAVSLAGQSYRRVRSVTMNNAFGENARLWSSTSKYMLYTNVAQIRSPARVFVFLDEDQFSINDGCFFSSPDTRWQIVDFPGSYHERAGDFSFADGHAELHRWTDPRTSPGMNGGPFTLGQFLTGDADIDWLQFHAGEPR